MGFVTPNSHIGRSLIQIATVAKHPPKVSPETKREIAEWNARVEQEKQDKIHRSGKQFTEQVKQLKGDF